MSRPAPAPAPAPAPSTRARSSSNASRSPRARPRPVPPPNPPEPPLTLLSSVTSRMQEERERERDGLAGDDAEMGGAGAHRANAAGGGFSRAYSDGGHGRGGGGEGLEAGGSLGRHRPWYRRFARRLGRGIYDDIRARAPYYPSDWTDAWNYRVVPATWFIFFANVFPGIAFSLDLIESTGEYGVQEVLLATFASAFVAAFFGGQPLTVLGVTGPITVFNKVVYDIIIESQSNPPVYLHFMGWVYLWGAIIHIIAAVIDACSLLRYVTRFSCDTFGFYVAAVYVQYGIQVIERQFTQSSTTAAFLGIILAVLTLVLPHYFNAVAASGYGTRALRRFCSDYGMPITVVAMSGLAYWGYFNGAVSEPNMRLPVVEANFQAANGRSWLVRFWQLEARWVGIAFPFGLVLFVLFYFDHNVSALIAQGSEFPLRKPPGFHWDFFLLGIIVFIAGLLGVPAPNGLIPQAPLHTASLVITGYEDEDHTLVNTPTAGTGTSGTGTVGGPGRSDETSPRGLRGVLGSGPGSGSGHRPIPEDAIELDEQPSVNEHEHEHEYGHGQERERQRGRHDASSASSGGGLHRAASGLKRRLSMGMGVSKGGSDEERRARRMSMREERAKRREVNVGVVEQRVSNLAQGCLCLVLMTAPFQHVLGLIPKGVLAGLFWYMGTDALLSSGLTEKMLYLVRDPQAISPSHPLNAVRRSRIAIFLAVELVGFGATFAVTQTRGAIGFPVIIMALVPVRMWVVPRLKFERGELEVLDGPVASAFTLESVGGSI